MKILEKLLEPISDENRAGPDLDDDAEAIRSAFESDFKYAARILERDDGGKPADWNQILSQIEDLSGQTKDLRLAIAYARCGIAIGDINLVDCGLQFVSGLLEDFWDDLHPIGDDGSDRDPRTTCCLELVSHGAFSLPFLKMPIANEGRNELTGEQISSSHENGPASQDYPVVKEFLDNWDEGSKNQLLGKLDSIVTSFEKIQNIMSEHCGADAPNFEDVTNTVSTIRSGFVALAGLDVVAETGSDEAATDTGGAKAFSGKIQSREDVVKALTEIENYYNLAEPGHPVKVALARMRSWVQKDFMEILQDIVPDSVSDAKRVLMVTQEADSG